jgi:hypothetical protein
METVNGEMCRDCTDVPYAKRNIDPAHPKDGSQQRVQTSKAKKFLGAVQFCGILADLNARREA